MTSMEDWESGGYGSDWAAGSSGGGSGSCGGGSVGFMEVEGEEVRDSAAPDGPPVPPPPGPHSRPRPQAFPAVLLRGTSPTCGVPSERAPWGRSVADGRDVAVFRL